jgi:hypothetical protein
VGILSDVKKILGIESGVTDFDTDITMHINSVLSVLSQLGIGPTAGLAITDDTTAWSALIGTEPRYGLVKTYVYLCVRRLFDPPATSYLLDAFARQIAEYEWRIVEAHEEVTAAT